MEPADEILEAEAVPVRPPPARRRAYEDEGEDLPTRRGRGRADDDEHNDFRCPFCGSRHPPTFRPVISTAGWVVFVVLLIFCLPLCVIGLFIKADQRVCSDCGIELG
ncbi:MAG TPA: LITAF-like zinc ribbon domain-containing protein [Gemmataceae bacterium]|nr:LITAF-like zinc ribbon domain-containing protein [Gemmataceae bacterium]